MSNGVGADFCCGHRGSRTPVLDLEEFPPFCVLLDMYTNQTWHFPKSCEVLQGGGCVRVDIGSTGEKGKGFGWWLS